MKKILTMLSAVAVAFGLRAAAFTDTGTTFEPTTAPSEASTNAFTTAVTDGELASGDFWSLPAADDSVQVNLVTLTDNADRSSQYTDADITARFSSETHYTSLSIATTGNTEVVRYAKSDKSAVNLGTGDDSAESGVTGDTLYFDSLVKFTPYDSDSTATPETILGTDGKIAIWVRENLDSDGNPASTNIVVTAGYIGSDGVTVTPTNYVCTYWYGGSVNELCTDWHRVTVKAMRTMESEDDNIYPAFAIAIDGQLVGTGVGANDKGTLPATLSSRAAEYNTIGGLFPANCQVGVVNANITSVAFRGQGEVDDLLFTETIPCTAFNEGGVTIAKGNNVESFCYAIGSDTPVQVTAASAKIAYTSDMTITISDVVYSTGYVAGGITANGATVTGMTITDIADQASITIGAALGGVLVDGTTAYATAAEAFTYINGLSEAPASPITVKLLQDSAEGVELDADGVSVILDLAGNTITGSSGYDAAITLQTGILTITNTTETVGVVDKGEAGAAVWANGGSITIADGIYDGAVYVLDAENAAITGGKFDIESAQDDTEQYYNPLVAALPEGYELVAEAGETPVYYVVQQIVTHTVTYYAPDADDSTYEATETVRDGELAAGPETAPVREGYTLAGWQTRTEVVDDPETDEVESGYEYEDFDMTTPITADIDLYAKWTEAVAQTWTVSFEVDGAAYGEAQTVNDGETATKPATDPSKPGYTFDYWTLNNEEFDFATPISADTTLVAKFTADTYTITYNLDLEGATNAVDAATSYTIETPTITLLAAGCDGYTFNGWTNTTGTAVTEIALGSTGNVVLYAAWTKNQSGIDPANDTVETTVTAESADAAVAAAKSSIVAPSGAGEGYADYFLYGVTDNNDGTYKVAITSIVETVESGVAASAVQRLTDSTAETIAVPAGLYYRITPSATLPISGNATSGLSNGSVGVTPVTADGKGFIKVELSPTEFK